LSLVYSKNSIGTGSNHRQSFILLPSRVPWPMSANGHRRVRVRLHRLKPTGNASASFAGTRVPRCEPNPGTETKLDETLAPDNLMGLGWSIKGETDIPAETGTERRHLTKRPGRSSPIDKVRRRHGFERSVAGSLPQHHDPAGSA
jgi:hypothetical protein